MKAPLAFHKQSWILLILSFFAICIGLAIQKLIYIRASLFVALCYALIYLWYHYRLSPLKDEDPHVPASRWVFTLLLNGLVAGLFCCFCNPDFLKEPFPSIAADWLLYMGLASLVEESIFREHLLTRLHAQPVKAFTAILFSTLTSTFLYVPNHWAEWPLRLLPGFFCAWIYWTRRRLDVCVALRWAWGCMVFPFLRADTSAWGTDVYTRLAIGGLLAALWLFAGNYALARRPLPRPL